MAAGARSLMPCLGGEEQGAFLCPDFKACCCIYRAQQPWQPSPAGALAAAGCCCSPALLGSRCPFGLTALGEMPAPSLREPGYVLRVRDSAFSWPAAPKSFPGGLRWRCLYPLSEAVLPTTLISREFRSASNSHFSLGSLLEGYLLVCGGGKLQE